MQKIYCFLITRTSLVNGGKGKQNHCVSETRKKTHNTRCEFKAEGFSDEAGFFFSTYVYYHSALMYLLNDTFTFVCVLCMYDFQMIKILFEII